MKTPIIIVSGFLGVGKTTWIQKLIEELKDTHRIMIIENDFGQVNFDSALLEKEGVEVTELSSGCICCSLVGDFKKALKKALKEIKVDLVIIEPSGVGKLSDIKNACLSCDLFDAVELKKAITIVDAVRSPLYVKNFGEFFKDQVGAAQLILFSHSEGPSSQIDITRGIVRDLNKEAQLVETPWHTLSARELIFGEPNNHALDSAHEAAAHHSCSCDHGSHDGHDDHDGHHGSSHSCCGHNHDEAEGHHNCCCHNHEGHGHHDHDCCHGGHGHHDHDCCHEDHNHHDAADTFVALPITLEIPRDRAYYETIMKAIEDDQNGDTFGQIVRIKGIVPLADENYLEIQYVPGHTTIKDASFEAQTITIIGHDLKEEALRRLWTH